MANYNGAWGGAAKLSPQSLPFSIRSEVQLYGSFNKIRDLSSSLCEALQGVRRIQRGSPRANQLRPIVSFYRLQFNLLIAFQCQELFTRQSHFPDPDMTILRSRLDKLQTVLALQFNDGGNDQGYSERVRLLERLNHTNGALYSVVEIIIEKNPFAYCQPLSPPFNIRSNVQLDDGSISEIRHLSIVLSNFHYALLGIRRILRGSPAAGQLGATVSIYRSQFGLIAFHCQEVFTKQFHFLVIRKLQVLLGELRNVLALPFNDEGNEQGYSERVHVLEKLHYTKGALYGVVEMIIEQHDGIAYWKCLKLANTYGHLQLRNQSGYQPPQ